MIPFNRVENGVKRTLTEDDANLNSEEAFRDIILRGFLQIDPMQLTAVLNKHPVGAAINFLLKIIVGGKEDSEWDKMEEKLTRKILGAIDDNNIEDRARDVNRITYLMGKAANNKFTKADLNEIRSFLPRFFPQQYTAGKYTPRWTMLLTKYLAILNACYIDLMSQNAYEKCEWADQLRNLKPLVLTAAKKLAKSRYQDLDKVDWFGGTTPFKPTARLQFRDKATGHDFGKVPLMQIQSRVFTPLEQETQAFLMENLIVPFNLLFNDTWTPAECNPPSEISEGDLDVKFPRKCMDLSGTCTFPCAHYSYKTKWCVKFKNHKVTRNKWKISSGGGRLTYTDGEDYWSNNCKSPDWETCMSTPAPPLIEWTDDDYNKRKKIWEGAMEKVNQTQSVKDKETEEVKETPKQKQVQKESVKDKDFEELEEEKPTPVNKTKATQQINKKVHSHKQHVKSQKQRATQNNKAYSQNAQAASSQNAQTAPYYYYNSNMEYKDI